MPESISSFGVSIAPAESTTSRRAVTARRPGPMSCWYSTPIARVPSKSTREAHAPVRTSRFGRLPMIGCRYAREDDARVPSGSRLIWKNPAPSQTVAPSLNRTVGSPTPLAASSTATPHGSSGAICMIDTGPERPCPSHGPSLFSSRAMSGQHSSALQPSQPDAAHSSRSSRGVQNAMHELCDEQPPSTFARAWRRKLLPRSCGSTR